MKWHIFLSILAVFIALATIGLAINDCPSKCEGNVRFYNGYYSSGYCHYSTEDCDIHDQEYGDRFCKSGDLYVKYKNYYCIPDGCRFTTYDQEVEECDRGGCNDGYCIISCDEECDTLDGFYGDNFCSSKSVFRTYRDYYCYRDVCRYREYDRSVEYCPEGCRNGECKGVSCQNHCRDDIWHYGASIISGRCEYNKIDCDTKDRESGSRYCKNNDVYVKFLDYYCEYGCKSVLYDRKIEDCEEKCVAGTWYNIDDDTLEKRDECYTSSCNRGKCIQTKSYTVVSRQEATKVLTDISKKKATKFSLDLSHTAIEKNLTYDDTEIFNGLFFGSDNIVIELPESEISYISFSINNTNSLAPLVIILNNETLYKETAEPDEYKLIINKSLENAVIKIQVLSSSWVFWSPANYDIRNIVIRTNATAVEENEFDFIIETNEYENLVKAEITAWPKNTSIILNNELLISSPIDQSMLKQGRNIISFIPWPGITKEELAEITVWYTDKAMV